MKMNVRRVGTTGVWMGAVFVVGVSGAWLLPETSKEPFSLPEDGRNLSISPPTHQIRPATMSRSARRNLTRFPSPRRAGGGGLLWSVVQKESSSTPATDLESGVECHPDEPLILLPLPDDHDDGCMDESFRRARWLMPSVVERAMFVGSTATDVVFPDENGLEYDDAPVDSGLDPYQLLDRLDLSHRERAEAREALLQSDGIVQRRAVLSPEQCARLRCWIEDHIQNDGLDNVDGCPDWQINIHEKKLRKLLLNNKDTVQQLWNLPVLLRSRPEASTPELSSPLLSSSYSRVGIFLRRYQKTTRPWMPFHRDDNQYTVNVALNSDEEFTGGRLLALQNGQVQIWPRRVGDATCHGGSILHAVSSVTQGTRYSLILFFHTNS